MLSPLTLAELGIEPFTLQMKELRSVVKQQQKSRWAVESGTLLLRLQDVGFESQLK